MAGAFIDDPDDASDLDASSPIEAPSADERWRFAKPFASLSVEDRARFLRECGMLGPEPGCLTGTDAFDVRPELTVGDACETAVQLLRGVIGSLEVLAIAPDLPPIYRDAISACAFLARQVAGAMAVIAAGALPGAATASTASVDA